MTLKTKRDYSLTTSNQESVSLIDDQIEDYVEENWWHPNIPRQELKALMQRSDAPALAHFGLWIALLIVSGYAAVLSWGTWRAIPAPEGPGLRKLPRPRADPQDRDRCRG